MWTLPGRCTEPPARLAVGWTVRDPEAMPPELLLVAARQEGLLTRRDVVAAGVAPTTLAHWVRRGRLRTVHRGVYALAGVRMTPRAQAFAAVLAVGSPAAAVSYSTAALVHGIGVLALRGPSHVTGPAQTHRHRRSGLVLHRDQLAQEDVVDLDGLSVTTVPRTAYDLLTGADRLSAVWACEAALRQQLVTDADLDEVVRRCAGRRHATRSRHWRALVDVRSESPLETAIRLLLVDAGVPAPVPQYQVRTADGHPLARLDLSWPDRRVGVEADGKEPHGQPRPIYTDRWRGNALVAWQLIRFTWHDVLRRPAYVVATVRAHLAAAA